MIEVGQIMSRPVIHVSPSTTVPSAATLMRDANVGILPVLAGGHAVGVLTDRDIITRLPPGVCCAKLPVNAVMTAQVYICHDTDPVETEVVLHFRPVCSLIKVDQDFI